MISNFDTKINFLILYYRSKPKENNHENIFIEYQENVYKNANESDEDISLVSDALSKKKGFTVGSKRNKKINMLREQNGSFSIETPQKINPMDISLEYQSTPLKQVEKDEFDILEESYVPLDVRLGENDKKKLLHHSSLQKINLKLAGLAWESKVF